MQFILNLPLVLALASRLILVFGFLGLVPALSPLVNAPSGWHVVGFFVAPWTTILGISIMPVGTFGWIALVIAFCVESVLAVTTVAGQL